MCQWHENSFLLTESLFSSQQFHQSKFMITSNDRASHVRRGNSTIDLVGFSTNESIVNDMNRANEVVAFTQKIDQYSLITICSCRRIVTLFKRAVFFMVCVCVTFEGDTCFVHLSVIKLVTFRLDCNENAQIILSLSFGMKSVKLLMTHINKVPINSPSFVSSQIQFSMYCVHNKQFSIIKRTRDRESDGELERNVQTTKMIKNTNKIPNIHICTCNQRAYNF